jgi:hypothetical protein
MDEIPQQQIRARYDEDTIRVYQAYRDEIADTALAAGRFVSPPYSMSRMTWIKPSFLWMMYRSGWGHKDPGQARILGIDISRTGFEWALAHACSSHRDPSMTEAEWTELKNRHPVRIQWDPERDLMLRPLPYRSLQIGLEGEAIVKYVEEWIVRIEDVTRSAHQIGALVAAGDLDQASNLLPRETEYRVAAQPDGSAAAADHLPESGRSGP